MGSLVRLRLLGDDAEHLAAVAESAFDEIARVERLLSWRDAGGETARINREAAERPVLVDFEMCDVLAACLRGTAETEGYFDVAAGERRGVSPTCGRIALDVDRRLVRFTESGVKLDFGAFGKGYALDRAAAEVRRYGVTDALLDAGTSSVLALGDNAGRPWTVGLRNPLPKLPDRRESWPEELQQLTLSNVALSCSATYSEHSPLPIPHSPLPPTASDLIDPHTGRPIGDSAGCAVVAATAAEAEILSTALVCMGSERAAAYTRNGGGDLLRAASNIFWIDAVDGLPRVVRLLDRNAEQHR